MAAATILMVTMEAADMAAAGGAGGLCSRRHRLAASSTCVDGELVLPLRDMCMYGRNACDVA